MRSQRQNRERVDLIVGPVRLGEVSLPNFASDNALRDHYWLASEFVEQTSVRDQPRRGSRLQSSHRQVAGETRTHQSMFSGGQILYNRYLVNPTKRYAKKHTGVFSVSGDVGALIWDTNSTRDWPTVAETSLISLQSDIIERQETYTKLIENKRDMSFSLFNARYASFRAGAYNWI